MAAGKYHQEWNQTNSQKLVVILYSPRWSPANEAHCKFIYHVSTCYTAVQALFEGDALAIHAAHFVGIST